MKRLKFFILLFCVAVSIPLTYVTWKTYQGLAREEQAQMRFFSEALFDRMENELAELVQREENRAVDEYQHLMAKDEISLDDGEGRLSPLADPPAVDFILGYLQNNPDGSFQTPLVADMGRVAPERRDLVAQLKEINQIFNQKKYTMGQVPASSGRASIETFRPKATLNERQTAAIEEEKAGFAERYLSVPKSKTAKEHLGQKETRVEEISARQAQNLAQEDESILSYQKSDDQLKLSAPAAAGQAAPASAPPASPARESSQALQDRVQASDSTKPSRPSVGPAKFQVEVAPFQSVFTHSDRIFIFRRIAINNQIYRQGFVLLLRPFLSHLAQAHFESQPLARFSGLRLQVIEQGRNNQVYQTGVTTQFPDQVDFFAQRTFPAPFDFLSADLLAETIPASPARGSLNVALMVLGAVMLAGLVAIYQSARTVVDLSERRTQFVSSVTHELKTPLTNIRMYIEMLEQGIAATPEREQDYLRILGTESARLGRLINNVLELAKLEKKQRHFQLQEGHLEDVFSELGAVMAPKVSQEGFELVLGPPQVPLFAYDREVLMQILINLVENSIKFGKQARQRRITVRAAADNAWVYITVADTGPGIPKNALRKVFDDFYRVDNDLTRATGGTGIGLALVKKFMTALGGGVQAANNDGPGSTITLWLPLTSALSPSQ